MTDHDRQPETSGSDQPASNPASDTDEHATRPARAARERTRNRGRGRRDAGRDQPAASDADRSPAQDDGADDRGASASADRDDDAQGDGEGADRTKRRRRRGRRGRGRGRGQPQDGERSASDADAQSDADTAGSAGSHDREQPAGTDAAEDRSSAASSEDDRSGDGREDAPDEEHTSEDASDEQRPGQDRRGRSRSGRAQSGRSRSGKARSTRARADEGDADDAAPDDGDRAGDTDAEVEKAIARGGTRMAAKKSGRRGSGNGGGNRRQQRPGGVPEEVRRAILEGPPRTMLVTAREDRTQISVMEDRTVVEHYVTRKEDVTYVGNIYMARVQNVLPGMEAAFLDIGKGRNGVLYAGEVLYDELDLEEGADERIENVLKQGQKVLVQVTKDPMGTKGPRLTMHLSLAGRYMVLAPNSDLFGISRKLTDKERDRLRRVVKKVKPDHHGVIVRTAAEGATEEQITADIERLLAKWGKVEEASADAKALTPVYEEPPLVVKVIRDNFGPEFERCIVDDEDLYHQVRGYLDEVAPELLDKVELYGAPTADARARAAGAPSIEEADSDASTDDAGDADAAHPREVDLAAARERREKLPPLFDAYDVTDQLRKAMGRKVWLPSGGYLIIETTEAMKVIDVNTGKFTGGSDTNLEEVVLKTNLEAADEIVRQLRLRDMGGIIIIDFIDMLLKSNQDQVVRRLKRELLRDRTKTRVSEVSRLGLVQMTRKNVSQGLVESFSHTCEHCEGRGLISEID